QPHCFPLWPEQWDILSQEKSWNASDVRSNCVPKSVNEGGGMRPYRAQRLVPQQNVSIALGSEFRELGRERPKALQPVRATGETTDSVSKVSPDAACRREHLGRGRNLCRRWQQGWPRRSPTTSIGLSSCPRTAMECRRPQSE